MIKFSIIIVVYNAEKLIRSTLYSLLNQTYPEFEVIIKDGMSSDKTLHIARSILQDFSQVKIISEKDLGIYDAMNKAIEYVNGDFIYFLNAGDAFFDDNVLYNVSLNISDCKNLYYGNALGVDKSGIVSPYRIGKFDKNRLAYTNICHQSIFYPYFLLKKERFNLDYKILADWELNMRVFQTTEFIYIDMPIALYDLSGISSYREDSLFKKRQMILIFKYLGFSTILNLMLRKLKKIIKI